MHTECGLVVLNLIKNNRVLKMKSKYISIKYLTTTMKLFFKSKVNCVINALI